MADTGSFLTPAERDRFATWLEQEAKTDKAMAEQAAKLPGLKLMVSKYRAEAMAAQVISSKLRSTIDETLENPS